MDKPITISNFVCQNDKEERTLKILEDILRKIYLEENIAFKKAQMLFHGENPTIHQNNYFIKNYYSMNIDEMKSFDEMKEAILDFEEYIQNELADNEKISNLGFKANALICNTIKLQDKEYLNTRIRGRFKEEIQKLFEGKTYEELRKNDDEPYLSFNNPVAMFGAGFLTLERMLEFFEIKG